MPRYFPLTKKQVVTKIVEVPVGDGSAVVTEQLRYDNYTKAKKAQESAVAIAIAQEFGKKALESVTAAFAAEITETNVKADFFNTVESFVQENAVKADFFNTVQANVQEYAEKADDFTSAQLNLDEVGKLADEDISNTVTATAQELGRTKPPVPYGNLYSGIYGRDAEIKVFTIFAEIGKKKYPIPYGGLYSGLYGRDNEIDAVVSVSEQGVLATENISNTATAKLIEINNKASDRILSAVIPTTEVGQLATETGVLNASATSYLNSVVSNTGWTPPNNSLGNTTNTAAELTATASGLLGTTNNTTNGDIVARFRDINLGDFTRLSVVLNVENGHANAGVVITQPTANIQFQYSLNSGGSWTTFYTLTGQTAKGIRMVDLTSVVAENSQLRGGVFRVRALGNVTSGTGVGAGSTASFYRAWAEITATRTVQA